MKEEIPHNSITHNHNHDHNHGDENHAEKNSASYNPQDFLTLEEIKQLDEKYLLQTYQRMPISFVSGSGEFLFDRDNKEYIDFLSGIAVTSLGHAHADLIETLTRQADMLWHTSNLYFNQQQAMLARALVEITFPGKVFFGNSGAEANEAALKLMRAWGQQQNPKREKIVSLKNSFHGRTFNAMSVTGQNKIHNGFGSLIGPVEFIDINDVAALDKAVDENTCGVLLEPIQGEGGVIPLSQEFMEKAREITRERKALLVLDEIQTGIGRSGKYFAFQHYNIQPDAVTMAKGLGGGFPIGAMLVADEFASVLSAGMHGSTFGGNHLATAVGYEVLRIMESTKVLDNVAKMSFYLAELLKPLQEQFADKIKDIRGLGLLIGIELRDDIPARPLVAKALEKRLLIGRAGENVLRLAPPLVLRKNTAERAIERLQEVIAEI